MCANFYYRVCVSLNFGLAWSSAQWAGPIERQLIKSPDTEAFT